MVNRFGTGSITGRFKNPYQFSAGRVSNDASDALYQAFQTRNRMQFELEEERSLLDRTFDVLQVGNYTTANFANDWVDLFKGNEGASFWKALNPFDDVAAGFRAANPFGEGSRDDQVTYSDVLENSGWKPESLGGKFAKGTVGFVGDVLLDPLTYLSGGTSAIVKGTGRTGAQAVRALDNVADLYNGGQKITHMTDDIAEKIIRDSSIFKSGGVADADLANQAKKLAENFNKQIGIRDVNPKPITIGIENMPFGDKIAPKLGVLGRTIKLSDGDNVRKLADTIGTARAYQKLRSSIYGSRIGELFSTNTGAWRAAQKDPAKLYDLMAFADMSKGLNLSKLQTEKMIRQKADELGILSKAETKEILTFLEDKTIWSKVKQVVKYADTKQADDIRKTINKQRVEIRDEYNHLSQMRKLADDIELAKKESKGVDVAKLEKEFDEKLAKMDLSSIKENETRYSTLKETLNKRIGDLTDQIKHVDETILKGASGETATRMLAKMANSVADEAQVGDIAKKLAEAGGQNGQNVHMAKLEREKMFEALSEVAFGHGAAFSIQSAPRLVDDSVPVLRDLMKYKGADTKMLDEFFESNKNFFGNRLSVQQKSVYADMINSGDFPALFRDFLHRNPGLVDDHAKSVYKRLASDLGYKSFHKDVLEPLRALMKERDIHGDAAMTPVKLRELNRLMTIARKRQEGIDKYLKGMDFETFKKTNKAEENRKLREEYERMLQEDISHLDVEAVTHRNRTDMFGHNIGDVVNNRGSGPALDPRGEKLPNPVRYAGREWDVFVDDKNVKYYYNAEQYEHPQIGLIPSGTRHKRGRRSIEPMPNAIEPRESAIPELKPPKEYTTAELMAGKHGEAIRNRTEAFLIESEMRRGKLNSAGVPAWMAKNKKRVQAMSSDVASVLRFMHPGKRLTELNGENEILDVMRSVARFQRKLADEKGGWSQLTDGDIRRFLNLEQGQKATLRKAERLNSISDDLDTGVTVTIKRGDKEYTGAITGMSEADGVVTYMMRDGEEFLRFPARDVVKVVSDARLKSPLELARENKTVRALLEERTSIAKQLDELEKQDPSKLTKNQMSARNKEVLSHQAKLKQAEEQVAQMEEASRAARERIDNLFGNAGSWEDVTSMFEKGMSRDDIIRQIDGEMEGLAKRITELDDALKSDEALEQLAREYYGDPHVESAINKHEFRLSGHYALKERASSKQVEEHVKWLRETFNQAGVKEVDWGKLSKEQFETMMEHYLPHVPTEDGKRYFASVKELKEHRPAITHDFGYGMKWNPHAQNRTIDGKNIFEINDEFREKLQGKNLFSESIAEIYTARMLKHEELRYDQEYMKNMMNYFGKDIVDGKVEEGYKAVANYGVLRKFFSAESKELMSEVMREKRRYGHTGEFTKEEMYSMFEEAMQNVVQRYGFSPDVLDKYALPMVELTTEQMHALSRLSKKQIANVGSDALVKQVSDTIVQKANQRRKIAIAKDENMALQMYDKFLHFMKVNQTTVVPSFHIRNHFSNMFQNWLGVGRDALDPRFQWTAQKAASSIGDIEALRKLKPIVSDDGKHVYYWDEIVHQTLARNGIDEGFFAQDIGATSGATGLFKNKINPKFNPTDTMNFMPYRVGAKVGGAIENAGRLLHVASLLKQGKTIDEAVESSIRYLFDYSDLTAFEQSVMKRIFPYYTWMRKNMRLQMSEVIEQPNKYLAVAKLQDWLGGMNNREDRAQQRYVSDFARDWWQTPFSMTNKYGDKEPILFNPNLPFMDIGNLPDPFNPKDSFREFMSQTAPQIKVPLEQALNKNFFFDSPLVQDGQSQVGARLGHLASQFALYNASNGVASKDNDVEAGLHLMGTLTGVKLMAFNYEASKQRMIQEGYATQSREGFMDVVARTVHDFADGVVEFAGTMIADGVVNLAGEPPKRPDAYDGAYMPISKAKYESLSAEEKKNYVAPTKEDANAYHRRAVELSEMEFKESGVMKRFAWALLEGIQGEPEKRVMGAVTNVADGDTFTVQVGDETKKIRLLLVDTPETVDPRKDGPMPYGQEASDYAKGMLFGKDVRLIIDGEDKYGRTLAYVEVDGNDYNKKLLEEGLGIVRYTFGNVDRLDEYYDAEIEAAKKKKGLWSIPDYAQPGVDTGFSQ